MAIAHIRDDGSVQSVKEHLVGSADLAINFAKPMGLEVYAELCGLYHDIGKYSKEFQNRITGNGEKCDHSSAGARLLAKEYGALGRLMAYCVTGHHSGLLDFGSLSDESGGTLSGRLSEEYQIPDYSDFSSEIHTEKKSLPQVIESSAENFGFAYSFFTRMLFSCLVDADFCDTEVFMSAGTVKRGIPFEAERLTELLEMHLKKFKGSKGVVNQKRSEISAACIEKAKCDRGIFTLTVPTGGGKTLSSMAFALNHAKKHKNISRVIYVIPYTSIIEQNSNVFSKVLGNEQVLQHHSGYDFKEDDAYYNIKKLATENWDMPIVVTTNVQFFESLFAAKTSRCRKLHNIANSVIIFDEVQMLPTPYLKPCIAAISELVKNYGCSAVLCSATQPAIDEFFPKELPRTNICGGIQNLQEPFKRTEYIDRKGLSTEALIDELAEQDRFLVIVNTKQHAKDLFDGIKGDGAYHLSTLMCPAHRQKVIAEIKKRLNNNQPCKVISTRLIEAGVDVDFPKVYRAYAGLDSIVQAAGRCNREGKLTDSCGNRIKGEVHIFKPEQNYMLRDSQFNREIGAMTEVCKRHAELSSEEAITDYFKTLYTLEGENALDRKDILNRLNKGGIGHRPEDLFRFPFKTVAEDFKLIETDTKPVIIPYDDEAKKLIADLKSRKISQKILRSLQKYTVNLYSNQYDILHEYGQLELIEDEIAVLSNTKKYDENTGLKIDKTFEFLNY